MPRALKVFRTAVGFRDAYVATSSKAAALRAWGTEKDLFARGAAELVTDPALTAEALSRPGEVVYRTRGGLEEQVAALGPLPKKRARSPRQDEAKAAKAAPSRELKPSRPAPRAPRPNRSELDAAEAELQALQEEEAAAQARMHQREQALAQERQQMEQGFAAQRQKSQTKVKQARAAYDKALKAWEP